MSGQDEIIQNIACKAVIVRSGKVLMVREAAYEEGTNKGKLQFPGGRLGKGEPFEKGLQREAKEELGCDVSLGKPVFVGEWWPVIRGVKNQIVAVFVECHIAEDAVMTLSEEHDEYIWIGVDELQTYLDQCMTPDNDVLQLVLKATTA